MPVPDYQSLMLPVLISAADGEIAIADARDRIAESLGLSAEVLNEMLPSGRQSLFSNRVSWARTYLSHAGLLETTRWGHFRITERGRELLRENPERIDNSFLAGRYNEFVEWRQRGYEAYRERNSNEGQRRDERAEELTPEERLEADHATLSATLREELLERLIGATPAYFEQVIVDLLVKMGYGGGRAEMGHAVGRSGDGGIDGIVKEDPLGLDAVYLQAKRYSRGNAVGPGDVRNFSGALDDKGTTKGLFVTTSSFSKEARDYVGRIAKRIILIDGQELAELMIKYNVGVRTRAVYEVKRIDEDYFGEE